MKAGETLTCPKCNTESFLVRKAIMGEWRKEGDGLFCSNCAELIERIELDANDNPQEKKKVLLNLFGDGTETVRDFPRDQLTSDPHAPFCRDCAHLVKHPFLTHCDLHNKDVNPMDDCPDFIPLEERN